MGLKSTPGNKPRSMEFWLFEEVGNLLEGVLWWVMYSGLIVYSSDKLVEFEAFLNIRGVAGTALELWFLVLGIFSWDFWDCCSSFL